MSWDGMTNDRAQGFFFTMVTWQLTGHDFDFGLHFIFLQGKKERRQAENLYSLGGGEARVIHRGRGVRLNS
jgi:hypothetical protein